MEHWRAKVARSEERRGCHRHRYLVAPKAILLFGTRTVAARPSVSAAAPRAIRCWASTSQAWPYVTVVPMAIIPSALPSHASPPVPYSSLPPSYYRSLLLL